MEILTRLLLDVSQAMLNAWDWIAEHSSDAWHTVDGFVNPVLSPLLGFLNPICTTIGNVIYTVLSPLGVAGGLVVVSVVVGVLMLPAFKHLSNQTKIARAKDDIKANLLALKLFKDELRVVIGAQFRILWAILRLQRYVFTPILWMTFPMLLVLAQMGVRYQWRPLHVGESTVLRVVLNEPPARAKTATLAEHPGVKAEVGPVPGDRDLVWCVRAVEPGRHTLIVTLDGKILEKELVVGSAGLRVSALRPSGRWTDQLFNPVEDRLPAESCVRSIEVEYPAPDSWFCGADYWVVSFFVISMMAALILAPVFHVRF